MARNIAVPGSGVVGSVPARLKVVADQFAALANRAAAIGAQVETTAVTAQANGSVAEAHRKVLAAVVPGLQALKADLVRGAADLMDQATSQRRRSSVPGRGAP